MADQNPPTGPGNESPGSSNPRNPKEIRHDAFFDNMGLDPSQPLEGMVCYSGILGRSSKEGIWTLYLRLDMSEYLEIRHEDIVSSQPLPPERSPFGSLGGSLVCVKKGATLNHVQTSSRQLQAGAAPSGEFDLDVRLSSARLRSASRPGLLPPTIGFDTCPTPDCPGGNTRLGDTCVACASRGGTCGRATCGGTCDTCDTQCGTCQTCDTQCGTCQTRCFGTCDACPQTGTCATCQTCRGETCETCATCQTCRGNTCNTCRGDTCNTCVGQTCDDTCAQTCFTCGGTCGRTCGCRPPHVVKR